MAAMTAVAMLLLMTLVTVPFLFRPIAYLWANTRAHTHTLCTQSVSICFVRLCFVSGEQIFINWRTFFFLRLQIAANIQYVANNKAQFIPLGVNTTNKWIKTQRIQRRETKHTHKFFCQCFWPNDYTLRLYVDERPLFRILFFGFGFSLCFSLHTTVVVKKEILHFVSCIRKM